MRQLAGSVLQACDVNPCTPSSAAFGKGGAPQRPPLPSTPPTHTQAGATSTSPSSWTTRSARAGPWTPLTRQGRGTWLLGQGRARRDERPPCRRRCCPALSRLPHSLPTVVPTLLPYLLPCLLAAGQDPEDPHDAPVCAHVAPLCHLGAVCECLLGTATACFPNQSQSMHVCILRRAAQALLANALGSD